MNESSNPDVDDVAREEVFPGEFLEMLQETASSTLEDYLRAHQAPMVVVDALRDLVFMRDLAGQNPDAWRPSGRKGWNAEIDAAVSRMVWEIRLLGGSFHAPDSEVPSRGEPVKWHPCGCAKGEVGDEAPDAS
jgi:hypothetical protein